MSAEAQQYGSDSTAAEVIAAKRMLPPAAKPALSFAEVAGSCGALSALGEIMRKYSDYSRLNYFPNSSTLVGHKFYTMFDFPHLFKGGKGKEVSITKTDRLEAYQYMRAVTTKLRRDNPTCAPLVAALDAADARDAVWLAAYEKQCRGFGWGSTAGGSVAGGAPKRGRKAEVVIEDDEDERPTKQARSEAARPHEL